MNEMEVISHLNVSVGLFPFTKILNLNIDHGPNVFGLCTIVGEMDHESADEIAQRTDESSETEVVTTASGQPARLFCGVVKNVSVITRTSTPKLLWCWKEPVKSWIFKHTSVRTRTLRRPMGI